MLQLGAHQLGRRRARTCLLQGARLAAERLPLVKFLNVSSSKVTQPLSCWDTLLSFKYLQRYLVSARLPIWCSVLALRAEARAVHAMCTKAGCMRSLVHLSRPLYPRHIDRPASYFTPRYISSGITQPCGLHCRNPTLLTLPSKHCAPCTPHSASPCHPDLARDT